MIYNYIGKCIRKSWQEMKEKIHRKPLSRVDKQKVDN